MAYSVQVYDKQFGWCLLCALNGVKSREEADRMLKAIDAGEALPWARKQYPNEKFRVSHGQAWWTDDNWIG